MQDHRSGERQHRINYPGMLQQLRKYTIEINDIDSLEFNLSEYPCHCYRLGLSFGFSFYEDNGNQLDDGGKSYIIEGTQPRNHHPHEENLTYQEMGSSTLIFFPKYTPGLWHVNSMQCIFCIPDVPLPCSAFSKPPPLVSHSPKLSSVSTSIHYNYSRTSPSPSPWTPFSKPCYNLGLSDKLDSLTLYRELECQALKANIQTAAPADLDI